MKDKKEQRRRERILELPTGTHETLSCIGALRRSIWTVSKSDELMIFGNFVGPHVISYWELH